MLGDTPRLRLHRKVVSIKLFFQTEKGLMLNLSIVHFQTFHCSVKAKFIDTSIMSKKKTSYSVPAPPKPMPSLLLFPLRAAAEAAPPGNQAAGRRAFGLAAAVPSGQAVLSCAIVVGNRQSVTGAVLILVVT